MDNNTTAKRGGKKKKIWLFVDSDFTVCLNFSQAECRRTDTVAADIFFTRQPPVRSSCSSSSLSPQCRCWAWWGWKGLQRWWSRASPLCWPPSSGSLEMDGEKNNNRRIKEVRLKEDVWDWATCEDVYESSFNIGGVQRWSLHEHEAFLLWGGESTGKEKFTINQPSRSFVKFTGS